MNNRTDAFKLALYAEERYTSMEAFKYPIEIEETWLGRSIEPLIHSLTGNMDSLEPYNIVSFRVLQRMANVLMNKIDIDVEDPFAAGVDVVETLKTSYKKNLKTRKDAEKTFWLDKPDNFISKLKEVPEQFAQYTDQHQYFTNNNAISFLRMFLTKKVPAFEEFLKKEYDESYERNKLKLGTRLEDIKFGAENKENEKRRLAEEESKHYMPHRAAGGATRTPDGSTAATLGESGS